MITRIVMLDSQLTALRERLFDRSGVEGAAFVLCGESKSVRCTKLIAHAIVPIQDQDFERREPYQLTIRSAALMRIAKLAKYENLSVVFAHSHPGGTAIFSKQDDGEEARLLPFLQARIPGRVHGTLVLSENEIAGRLYCPAQIPVDSILVVGDRIRSWYSASATVTPFFDRQVRAFGHDIQQLLATLHIGVVGLGGTGSPVAEQLTRLGVGRISLFDGDVLDESNVNRIYGSHAADRGLPKVAIAKKHLEGIGVGTTVNAYDGYITVEEIAKALRDCDIIFGCTDKELPRAILVQLSLRYTIPVIDLGVLIASSEGKITGVHGRATTLIPGEACLFCRGRISSETIRHEALSAQDRASQARDGYVPELEEPAPAVITFTTATASAGVSELLHRLTGFMGNGRRSSEVLLAFDQSRVRTNRIEPKEDCICSDHSIWGRGDTNPFMEMVWSPGTR